MSSFALTFTTPHARGARGSLASAASAQAVSTLDLALGGELLPASSSPQEAAWLLRDLLTAALTVAEGRAPKARVPFHDMPWELCVAAGDGALLVSAYRTGPQPDVRVVDHPVSLDEVVAQARGVLAALPSLEPEARAQLVGLVARLAACERPLRSLERAESVAAQWRSRPRSAVGSGAAATVAVSFQCVVPGASKAPRGESAHADLHALLARGVVSFELRGRRVSLAPGYLFLHFERLVALCRPLMEAWSSRRALNVRAQVGASTVALRLGQDDQLAVTLAHPSDGTFTAPSLEPCAFVAPVLDGALALATTMARADRALARNLRLRALRNEARTLRRWLRGMERSDVRVNPDPALYRAVAPAATASRAEPDIATLSKLRYTQRWRAEVEGIDLAGTLLCGDRLVVPGNRELHALDRATGAVVWSVAVGRAATTLAGDGILRLTPRGEVELRAVSTGEALWTTRVAPRVGGGAAAHAVSAQGLPRIVVLAEGERRLVALDLRTGEARWAWTSRQGGAFKMRRVGKLLVVASGDATVTALDLVSGEPVWRHAGRGQFASTPLVHRDRVFALAGEGTRAPARLQCLDAYSGEHLWTVDADAPACVGPVATGDTVALALAGREGATVAGYHVDDGAARFEAPLGALPGVYNARPALAAIDDLLVANLPTGRVVAVDAASGEGRWSHAFRAPVADDVPRRLDVQLRAGALFVPQSALAVVRPRDGALLAQVDACDLVPDLVRVDEQCALYVAEESGHVGCYELGARLRVLRPA